MAKVVTRSSNLINKYRSLEEFFKTSEEDNERFVYSLADIVEKGGGGVHEQDSLRKLVSGKPDTVKTPKRYAEQVSGFVRITYGPMRDDYVWHIEHASIRRPWKISDSRLIRIIAKIMHDNLPDIGAKIWPPLADWELRVVTFKAIGLASMWNFEESIVEKINKELFEVLNTVV